MSKPQKKRRQPSSSKSPSFLSLENHILRLARRWQNDRSAAMPDAQFDNPEFDAALTGASVRAFLGNQYPIFMADLQSRSMHQFFILRREDGPRAVADCQLFFIPVAGATHEIDDLLRVETNFTTFRDSFKRCGLASADATVWVAPYTINSSEAASLGPGALRRALDAFFATAIPNPENLAPPMWHEQQAKKILGGQDPLIRNNDYLSEFRVGSRLLVGFHLVLVDCSDNSNNHGDPDYFDAIRVGVGSEDEEDINLPTVVRWKEEMDSLFGGLMFYPPREMSDALGASACMTIQLSLAFDSINQNIPEDVRPEAVCLEPSGEGHVAIWFDFDGVEIGRVVIPIAMFEIDIPHFLMFLESMAPIVNMYNLDFSKDGHTSISDISGTSAGAQSLLSTILGIPGKKTVTCMLSDGPAIFHIDEDDAVGCHASHQGPFRNTIERAYREESGIIVRQFSSVTVTIDGPNGPLPVPIKMLYGCFVKNQHVHGLTAEELRVDCTTDAATGKPIDPEAAVFYRDWPTLENGSNDPRPDKT